MKWIKTWKNFSESLQWDISILNVDLNESLGMFYENILKSIGAEEIEIDDKKYTLKLTDPRGRETKMDLLEDDILKGLETLSNNSDFINSLKNTGLKKSPLQSTEDFDTFVNRPSRFIMIYRIEANELENPEYIIFQSWNSVLSKWEDPKLFKIKGNFKNFYDKLSSRDIELEWDNKKWTYHTANKNEWILKNGDETDMFKKNLRKDELEKVINDNKIRITIL